MSPRPFSSLTLRGRARRLARLARTALQAYDFDLRRMRLLSNDWNCVFRLDTPDRKLVLRVTLPGQGHSAETVQAEAAFLAALQAESELEVPRPIPARDGRLVVPASAPGVPEERMCVVYSWIPGRDLASEITPANWRKLGALHARLHEFAARWTPPSPFVIHDYRCVFHYPAEVVLWNDDVDLFGHRTLLREAAQASDERIAALRARDGLLVTHGDLHQRNVKLSRGVLRPIDFEDLMWATRGLDVGTSLYYVSRRKDYAALRDAFRAGYEQIAPWVEGEPGEVDRLLFPRALLLLDFFATRPGLRMRSPRYVVGEAARLARIAVG